MIFFKYDLCENKPANKQCGPQTVLAELRCLCFEDDDTLRERPVRSNFLEVLNGAARIYPRFANSQ